MNKYTKIILERSIEYRKQHSTDRIKIMAKNQDELIGFISSFEYLINEGYIIPVSKNYNLHSYDIPRDLTFIFELTQKAIDYILFEM